MAVQAAYIGAIVQREKSPKKVHEYYNAKQMRDMILNGTKSEKKKADFTLYNKLKNSMKDFDWSKAMKKQ